MSFHLQTSVYNDNVIGRDQLTIPIANNLETPTLYSKVPIRGSIAYNEDNETLYVGNGQNWQTVSFTGSLGPTGTDGHTGHTGHDGPTGAAGNATSTGSTGFPGSVGNTGSQGATGTMSREFGYVAKTQRDNTDNVSLGFEDPMPMNFVGPLGGSVSADATHLIIGVGGVYQISFGYGNIQVTSIPSTIPQSMSLFVNNLPVGGGYSPISDAYTLQEYWNATLDVNTRYYLNSGGQSLTTTLALNDGDALSLVNTINNENNLPRVFENATFTSGSATLSGSVAGWISAIKLL